MGNYYWSTSGIQRDELQGGGDGIPTELWNIDVGSSATITRGDLLCASSPTGIFSLVGSTVDAGKVFTIARDDFIGSESSTVTQAYASGKFNRERINLGGGSSLTLEPFENELRKQNIHVTSIQDKF